MRRTVFFTVLMASLMVLAGVVLAAATPGKQEQAPQIVQQIPVSISTTTSAILDEPLLPEAPKVDPRLEPLTDYFETAMNTWARPDRFSADYHSIASDMAEVVLAEEPIWDSDKSRARTGIMMLGIAFWESRYRAYVDDASCNKFINGRGAPKELVAIIQNGNCDGGWAHSLWQVHPMKWNAGNGHFEDFSGDRLNDRKTAIRAALLIARRSIRNTRGLCWYTGEGADGNGCPKAVQRYDHGITYSRKNPFTEKPEPQAQNP